MKKIFTSLLLFAISVLVFPAQSLAAGGIYASGGGNKTVGQSFTVTVTASGATFDTVSGSISVSGPVSVTSFTAGGGITWINQPTNGGSFNGAFLGQKQTSFTVATIKLKATGVGSGAVSVSGASLKNAGSVVGSGSGSASYSIAKAPELPGAVTVASSSHPDQNATYEATTIDLSWNKDSGVDGFSYLLDQAGDTTPAAKITDANTSVSYPNQAVGTYYFHIRAHKPDGWGGTTTFKISIKEPDPKIDQTLSAPTGISIEKSAEFINNVAEGTVTGIVISGMTEPGFTANLTLTPAPTLPEGKTLSAVADNDGKFQLVLDYPIISGYHKLTIQGQKNKILTPVSEATSFEISQAKGGTINILTDDDKTAVTPVKAAEAPKKSLGQKILNKLKDKSFDAIVAIILLVAVALTLAIIQIKKRQRFDKIAKKIITK